jgi:hypothetical protein
MPPIRARDLRVTIKEMGFEKGVVHTLELALEEMAGIQQHLRDLTELSAQCVDQIAKFIQIAGGMREVIDRIKRSHEQGDEHGDVSG